MLNMTRWPLDQIAQHSIDPRQFMDFRLSTLPNGSRIIEAYNGSGLTFTLLPDRGLDIWTAHYKGIPLTWISQGSPHPPDFGLRWTQQFNGGLLTTCGLTHVGPPETDDETGEWRDLHGLYSRLRAQDVAVTRGSMESVDLTAVVTEQRLFGEQLELARLVTLNLGDPTIYLTDVVTNLGDLPTPLMILYHVNVGFPLVSAGARLVTPSVKVVPRDEVARPGAHRWDEYDSGTPGYAEQVFYHQVTADGEGMSEVALLHEDFGLSVAWDTRSMPYFCQWKNTRDGIYVSGLEPANCLPEGRNAARRSGRLVMIQPGQSQTFHARIQVLEGVDAVEEARERIADLRLQGAVVTAAKLDDFKG